MRRLKMGQTNVEGRYGEGEKERETDMDAEGNRHAHTQ